MITAGIDVGLEYTKIIILNEKTVLAKAKTQSGGAKRAHNVQKLWSDVLEQAAIKPEAIEKICITGKGKYNTGLLGDRITELTAAQAAAQAWYPDAVQVICAGADETLVFERTAERICEYTLNQKCSAGLGLFLEETETLLEIDLKAIDPSANASNVFLNDACVNFAGMDLLEGLNRNEPKEELAMAALQFSTTKLAVVMNDITLPNEGKTVLAGGLFLYPVVSELLKEHTRNNNFTVAEEPDYFMALGAALHAASMAV